MTAREERRRRWVHVLRGGLLLGFAALIAKLFLTGEMVKYMTPALDPLTALTGAVMAAMGVMELAQGSHPADGDGHGADPIEQILTCVLVVLPLALGTFVSARALGVGALGGEPVASLLLAYAPGAAPSPGVPAPAPSKPITDTADILAYLQQVGVSGVGQPVRATGLALRSEGLGEREFALVRYLIAHCVADARPVALLVVASVIPALTADQWIEVEGVLGAREREGSRLVTIVAERVRPISEPPNPYLRSSF
jgi:putative membrane protein